MGFGLMDSVTLELWVPHLICVGIVRTPSAVLAEP